MLDHAARIFPDLSQRWIGTKRNPVYGHNLIDWLIDYYYLGIPQQRESFSLIEGVSRDRYESVEAQLLCMWDGAI